MKKINSQEVDELLATQDIGYVCFMGGIGSDASQTIYAIGRDDFYLFTREEIEQQTPEYLEVVKKQNQESEEYMDAMFPDER